MIKNYTRLFVMVLLFSSSATFAQEYISSIQRHLNSNRSALGVQASDIEDFIITNEVPTRHNNVTHVYAAQRVNGIPIYNAQVNAAFRNGAIVYLSQTLELDIANRASVSSPTLNPMQAATSAATALELGASSFSVQSALSSQEFILNTGDVSLENVPVKLVYVPVADGSLRLAWDLSIHTVSGDHWWSIRVDALNGNLIDKNDWIVSCTFESHGHNKPSSKINDAKSFTLEKVQAPTAAFAGEQYNVYPLPLESPNHGAPSLVVDPQDLTASPFGWHDIDGIEGPEFTITRGNNVWAQEDQNGNNGIGFSPDGQDNLNFDFPYNFDTNPANMVEAVTTNLFYWNNAIHDILYRYGFDEASGNFQETNYTGAGAGSDFVFADSQDGSGLNNATFGTPPDGQNPRMSMFLWNASGPPGESVTVNNGSLSGSYIGVPATFGDPLPEEAPITADLALFIDDNSGESTDEIDACDPVTNGSDLNNQIVVIRRGICEFGFKVLAAENEGALAVIVVNNAAGAPIAMGPGADGDQVSIPSVMVSQEDGEAIITALQNGEEINVSLLNGGPFQVDGSVDNGIIAHEYGHGVSGRLTGGPQNSNCMRTCVNFDAQGRCITGFATEVASEGWSDYFGLILTMREGDAGDDIRGIGTFAIGQPTDGGGIRPTPYSTNFAVNASTYDSVATFENTTAPHPVGYVWTTMIWDMTWGLIDQYGFDADIYNGSGGNNIALQLVMDGLKLQPCNPGFVDARDAILAAVAINPFLDNDNERAEVGCIVWTAFANRGLGWSADQGDWREREDGTSATDFPPDDVNPCNALSISDRSETSYRVFPNPSNGEININVGAAIGQGSVRILDINGREVYAAQKSLEGTVRVEAQGLATGVYLLQIQSDSVSQTTKIVIE